MKAEADARVDASERISSYRWFVLTIGIFAQMCVSAMTAGLPAIGPAIQQHFSISLLQTGALFSALITGSALTLVAWGVLADRWGERLVLGIGLAAWH
jgi:MFS family permease